MVSDFRINKLILMGVGFLIVFAVACVLWYQYDTRHDRREAAETAELLRLSKSTHETDKGRMTQEAVDEVLLKNEIPTVEKPTTKSGKIEKNTGPNRILLNQTEDSHVNNKKNWVSPYGFGPYPKLPNGWKDVWETLTPKDELAMRVWIQLLEQGIPVEGIGYIPPNKLLVPIIKGTVYAKTDDREYLIDYYGHPDDGDTIETLRKEKLTNFQNLVKSGAEIPEGNPMMLTVDDLPKHLIILDVEDAIDPYTFLNLKKE